MKHAYSLLLIAGIFAAGCKKDKKSEGSDTRLHGGWYQDMSLILTPAGYRAHDLRLNAENRFYLLGGLPPAEDEGSYSVRKTENPDSVVLTLKFAEGGTRTYPVLIRTSNTIEVYPLGTFHRKEY